MVSANTITNPIFSKVTDAIPILLILPKGTLKLEVNPEQLEKITKSASKSQTIYNLGERSIPLRRSLSTITIKSFIWLMRGQGQAPLYFTKQIEAWRDSGLPARLMVCSATMFGQYTMNVTCESFTYSIRAGEEKDLYYTLELKEYLPFRIKEHELVKNQKIIKQIKEENNIPEKENINVEDKTNENKTREVPKNDYEEVKAPEVKAPEVDESPEVNLDEAMSTDMENLPNRKRVEELDIVKPKDIDKGALGPAINENPENSSLKDCLNKLNDEVKKNPDSGYFTKNGDLTAKGRQYIADNYSGEVVYDTNSGMTAGNINEETRWANKDYTNKSGRFAIDLKSNSSRNWYFKGGGKSQLNYLVQSFFITGTH